MLLCELQTKDVINVCTAKCLGRVMDLEIDEKRIVFQRKGREKKGKL